MKNQMILITGGASSGKSAMAEEICCRYGGDKLYIATMEPHGAEAEERIRRHRALRESKCFHTLERYSGLEEVTLTERYGCALLECLGNLAAGEMFSAGRSPERAVEKVMAGVENIRGQVPLLVVVTNEVFSGAERYTGDMAGYLACLGRVNRRVAWRADTVIESVCGLPIFLKGAVAD